MSRHRAIVALAASGPLWLFVGCGLDVTSPDLFRLTRTGAAEPLTLTVNDGGTIRCNGDKPKPITDALLLQARALATSLDSDAKRSLRLRGGAGSVFSYVIRLQDGTISFPDTAATRHHELAQAELFALRAAREVCGLTS